MRRATAVALGVVAAAAALATWAPVHDPDLWWHLATGRQALATRSTLPVDPFSFTFAGAPWRYKDLCADALLWAAFAGGGFVAVWLLEVAAAVAIALGFGLARRTGASGDGATGDGAAGGGAAGAGARAALGVLVAAGVTLLMVPLAGRPSLFSLALFPTVLALLERRRFGWLVAVTWVWILLHRAALLGYVLVGGRTLHLALATACARWPRLSAIVGEPPPRRALAVAAIATVAAPLLGLVNPSGRAAFVSAVDVTGSGMLKMYIAEWKALGWAALGGATGVLLAVTALALLVRLALAARRGRRAPVDLWHVGLVALFAVLATRSVRWLPFADMSCALVLLHLVDEAAASLARPRAIFAVAATALVVGAFVGRRGAPFGLGADPSLQPTGAVAFAEAHHLGGPVIHSYEFGGYLIWSMWPRARVLVDGRLDQVYPPAFVATCIQAERNPAYLPRLGAEAASWAIGSNHDARFTHRYLYRDPAWMEVYWSDAASVYVRRAAHPELASLAFVAIDPAAPELSVAEAVRSRDPARIAAAQAELGRMVAASPTSVRANGALAIYFHLLGRTAERDTVMRLLETVAPDHPAVKLLRRRFSAPAARAN